MDPIDNTGYALGTVIAGYLFVAFAWLVSVLWNRYLPNKKGNPWTFPLVTSVLIILLMFVETDNGTGSRTEDLVIGLGTVPAFLTSLFRRARHGLNQEEPKL